MFDGFEASTVDTDETTIFIRRKGNGRPLLLLHGFPEMHAMWHAVAPTLGDAFTVICADLRGYGASGKPPSTPDHAPFGGGQHNSRPSDDDSYRPPRQRQQQPNQHTQQEPSESSRAPPPKKAEAKDEQTGPTTSIVVMGDDMADWLAHGLEDVFSDTPEIRVVRKNKLNSGLLRYDAKGDLDWWHVARDTMAQEKADYVVMMLGVGDRQEIRVKDLAKEADTRAKDQQAKDQAAKDPQGKDQQAKEAAEKKDGQKPAKTNDTDENGTSSAQPAKKTGGPAEFRSEEWEKVYSRRIDDTIAALKSKGAPVIGDFYSTCVFLYILEVRGATRSFLRKTKFTVI